MSLVHEGQQYSVHPQLGVCHFREQLVEEQRKGVQKGPTTWPSYLTSNCQRSLIPLTRTIPIAGMFSLIFTTLFLTSSSTTTNMVILKLSCAYKVTTSHLSLSLVTHAQHGRKVIYWEDFFIKTLKADKLQFVN